MKPLTPQEKITILQGFTIILDRATQMSIQGENNDRLLGYVLSSQNTDDKRAVELRSESIALKLDASSILRAVKLLERLIGPL